MTSHHMSSSRCVSIILSECPLPTIVCDLRAGGETGPDLSPAYWHRGNKPGETQCRPSDPERLWGCQTDMRLAHK